MNVADSLDPVIVIIVNTSQCLFETKDETYAPASTYLSGGQRWGGELSAHGNASALSSWSLRVIMHNSRRAAALLALKGLKSKQVP